MRMDGMKKRDHSKEWLALLMALLLILKTMADAKVVLPENPLIVLRTLRFQARFSFDVDENLDAA